MAYDVPVPAEDVSHRDNVYPGREKPEPVLNVIVEPDAPDVLETEPVPPFELYNTTGAVDHCANNIVDAVIVNVSPGEYDVPVPSAFVFQPAKIRDVFVRLPVLPSTVTVSPDV